jgi:hypothetical protein
MAIDRSEVTRTRFSRHVPKGKVIIVRDGGIQRSQGFHVTDPPAVTAMFHDEEDRWSWETHPERWVDGPGPGNCQVSCPPEK